LLILKSGNFVVIDYFTWFDIKKKTLKLEKKDKLFLNI